MTGTSIKTTAVLRLLVIILAACIAGGLALRFDHALVVSAHVSEGGTVMDAVRQPYTLTAGKQAGNTLTLQLRYFGWQDATLHIENSGGCLRGAWVRPLILSGPEKVTLDASVPCGNYQLVLAPYLLAGLNDVTLQFDADKPRPIDIYVSHELYGSQATSTLACQCLLAAFALGLYVLACRLGLDRTAAGVLVAGFVCYASLLHVRPDLFYSNDLTGHIAYLRYMAEHALHPYEYRGWEYFHPPLYYALAGKAFAAADSISGLLGPLLAVRMLGLALYMIFCFFGLKTLMELTDRRGAIYMIAACLIVFWPTGTLVATRISNDVPVYAAWSASFYFLVRWHVRKHLNDMQWAVALAGLTLAFKTSGLLIVVVTGCMLLYGWRTGRLHARDALKRGSLWATVAFMLGVLANSGRFIHDTLTGGNARGFDYLSPGARETHATSYFFTFDVPDYLRHPVVTFQHEPGFLNYFLKTVLYNEQQMGGLFWLPATLNLLLLVMLAGTLAGAFYLYRQDRMPRHVLFVLLAGALIPPLGPFIFMALRHYMFCQSFRFTLPMLVPLCVLTALSAQTLLEDTRQGARRLGAALTSCMTGFLLISFVLNCWLYSHGQFG